MQKNAIIVLKILGVTVQIEGAGICAPLLYNHS
jgi:hypothetical protein